MVARQWSAGAVDIKTAFLNAELEEADHGAKRVVIRAPGLWRRLGICVETFWDVQRALYGLQISPAAWARCRDRTLPGLKLLTRSGLLRLVQFESDPNIWALVPGDLEEPVDPSQRLGLLLVYVDDLMVLSTPQIITEVIAELGKKWELSKPELLEDGCLHYRGVEIQKCGEAVLIHQGSYTRELLSSYPDIGGADVPALKLQDVPTGLAPDKEAVRKAQQMAGELLWLSGLTRPEMQYAVGAILRMISVNPLEAISMGEQAIKYLVRYPGRGLVYRPSDLTWEEEGELSVPMSGGSLTGFCDASFAPQGGRSQQATTIFYNQALIAWSSSRQGHITMSTAEAELVAITTLFGELRALEPLVAEIAGEAVSLRMHSDSQAAIAICNTAANNWRTRHLRLRPNYIKEALESGRYSLHHVCGQSMRADLGTKPLPSPRFHQLTALLGMGEPGEIKQKGNVVDGSLEEKIKTLLVCLMVASLVDTAEGARTSSSTLSDADWQFLGFLAVVVICGWEILKSLSKVVCRNGRRIVGFCSRVRPWTVSGEAPQAATEAEDNSIHVFHHVDDVVIIGPRQRVEAQAGQVMEESTAPQGPGAPLPTATALTRRPRPSRSEFQFRTREFTDWPAVLSWALSPVGQDRYEYRPGHPRTVLRWHVAARTRMFVPSGTTLPVTLTRFTGRRRTWLIDVTEGAPYGRVLHLDNWKEDGDARAYVHFSWIGYTEFEVIL